MEHLNPNTASYLTFIDGACSGNPGPGGWGSVVLDQSTQTVTELGGGSDQTTNNIMELSGLVETLKFLDFKNRENPFRVSIFMDSQNVLNGSKTWRINWKKKGWRKADNSPVMNLEIWKNLDQILENLLARGCQFEWNFVKAHSGNPANERVDEIAVQYSKKIPANLFSGRLADLRYDLLGST